MLFLFLFFLVGIPKLLFDFVVKKVKQVALQAYYHMETN